MAARLAGVMLSCCFLSTDPTPPAAALAGLGICNNAVARRSGSNCEIDAQWASGFLCCLDYLFGYIGILLSKLLIFNLKMGMPGASTCLSNQSFSILSSSVSSFSFADGLRWCAKSNNHGPWRTNLPFTLYRRSPAKWEEPPLSWRRTIGAKLMAN